jgi:hypothetical protein
MQMHVARNERCTYGARIDRSCRQASVRVLVQTRVSFGALSVRVPGPAVF